nr:MAG TPA: hypothetical protein [Caudoviricetes sp.]
MLVCVNRSDRAAGSFFHTKKLSLYHKSCLFARFNL